MDSPETNKIVFTSTSSTTSSPVVQESPFFNYLRTLSPIKPVKAAHVAQGFPELSIPTPPSIFTSPRLNPQSETFFLNRSKHFHSSNKKISIGHEGIRDSGHTFSGGTDVSEQSFSRLTIRLVPCDKGRDSKGSAQVQPSSPSQNVDEFLADPVELVKINSSGPDICLNQVDDTPEVQLGCMRSKETTVNVNNDNDKYVENGSDVQITSSEQTELDLRGRSVTVFKTGRMKTGESQSMEYHDLASAEVNDINFSNSCMKPVSGAQNSPYREAQSAEGEEEVAYDNNNQVLSAIMPIDVHVGVAPNESVETKIVDPKEVGQNPHGKHRRCLQFEASVTHRKSIVSNRGFSSPAIISRCSRLPANSTDMEMLESSDLDCGITKNICTSNYSQPMAPKPSPGAAKTVETHNDKINTSVQNGGNPSIKAPLSGIGLHLNSIVNTAAMGCTASFSRKPTENDYPSAQRKKSPSVPNQYLPAESMSISVPASVLGKISVKRLSYELETQSIAENSATFQFPHDNADRFQEFNQLSPQKKRKRTFTIEDEGCKRCNCRRSKCLKLYCECFAVGIYCAEPCACQECFNKPQYEDKVLETRKQIESRNPLAFAPKIVRRDTDSPANTIEDNKKVTPASTRHKRGCNCKKSMCLKKYCECYQSGVGCSAGCRCEGCKNAFGIKEGYGEISEMVSRKVDMECWEDSSDGKVAVVTRNKFIEQEHRRPQNNLTPLTPSLQSSNQGEDMPISRLPGRRFLPSPESETNHSSTRYVFTHERLTKMDDGNLDIVFDQEVEFSTTGRIDQFSPRWDGFENICDLTPLPQTSSKAMPILSPSNSRDSGKVSRIQLQGSVRLSGSLRWRSSPIASTPLLGESKLRQEPGSDVGCEILEDDTPDILKDTHTPIKTVKASSPNQKRVSPPYSHLHNLRSSPSPGLKSGRKFVLQSISSFPSLTPYSDPKDCSSKK